MKAILLAVAVVAAGAVAHAEGGAEGGAPFAGADYTSTGWAGEGACRNGQTTRVLEQDNSAGDSGVTRPVTYTCANGRWAPRSAAPSVIRCREGQTQMILNHDNSAGDSGTTSPVWYTCRGGRYVR